MELLDNAALTLAIALAAGLAAQVAAIHLRFPGIVLLLATGVLLGPDVANIVRPGLLSESLPALVGYAVSVILFDGGLGLDLRQLRREGRAIRQLVTLGAIVTTLGGMVAARLLFGWSWRLSALFGTLIIVTGPTVTTPLLRRLKVKRTVTTILEAEGVLIDAIGATIATIALEIALRPSAERFAEGAVGIALRLGAGATFGMLGGLLIGLPLRRRKVVPEGLETVVTLSLVLLLFQLSEAVLPESGIAAVIVAGVVVRNSRTQVERELRQFKEQLTVMLIGMLFVILAANVRLANVAALGARGWIMVGLVIAVIRPLNVLAGTWRTELGWRQKLFLAWIGPRGIVAAAVASLVAGRLERAGIEGGRALQSMVFLVIAATVIWSGLTGGVAASWLGLRRKRDSGWVILGAGQLARTVAKLLASGNEEVLCIEANPRAVSEAERDGLRAILGNGLEERTLQRAEIDTRSGALALTPNENTNFLFLQRVRAEAGSVRALAALESWDTGVTAEMVKKHGGEVLFASALDVQRWSARLEAAEAAIVWWRRASAERASSIFADRRLNSPYLPLVSRVGDQVLPVGSATKIKRGSEVAFVIDRKRRIEAEQQLRERGFEPCEPDEAPVEVAG